ncbi:HNH endonuclease signature motif containing protein, partial [Enterocloster clostridioformis]|uniref:HNH endonuclease signature motif containing protein n=1 Tax=Enterocloster clostridioformis TaxID=1531 RepID=UPI000672294A
EEFSSTHEIHCHHKLPRYLGGDDSYGNLILVKDSVHKLIHAINADTIRKIFGNSYSLTRASYKKVNNAP